MKYAIRIKQHDYYTTGWGKILLFPNRKAAMQKIKELLSRNGEEYTAVPENKLPSHRISVLLIGV